MLNKIILFCLLFIPCEIFASMDFPGTNQYLDISSVANDINVTSGTISIWVNLDNIAGGGAAGSYVEIGKSGDNTTLIGIREISDNTLQARYRRSSINYDAELTSATSNIKNIWTHLVMVWDASNVYSYLNGDLKNTTARGADTSGLDQAYVSCRGQQSCIQNYIDGKVGDVRIYARALSATEIKILHDSRSRLFITDGLIGCWRLDQGTEGANAIGTNSALDISGYANHGTPQNTPTWYAGEWLNYP